jgi:hypothetical protein
MLSSERTLARQKGIILDAGLHAVPHRHIPVTGLTWFNVFQQSRSLVYGRPRVHGLRHSLVRNGPPAIYQLQRTARWLDGHCISVLSILGVNVFWRAGDIPVMLTFVGLTLIYAIEVPTRLLSWRSGTQLIGLFQFLTGIWLMYCTYAVTVNLALGAKAWI